MSNPENRVYPVVSVIIPTFNRAHLVRDTLNSVISQSYQKWECIVVDDGSTDATLAIVEEYTNDKDRFSCYHRPITAKKGPSACRNFGLSVAQGKYVVFLDSDDVLAKDCLEKRVSFFEVNQNLDFVVFSMGWFKTIDKLEYYPDRKVFKGTREQTIKHFIAHAYPWNTTRPIYNKTFVEKNGGFNENLTVYTDPEMALRILLKSNPTYDVIDETDCYYRVDNHYHDKYEDKVFQEKICINFLKFKKMTFEMLSKSEKRIFANELKYEFIKSQIYFNGFHSSDLLSEMKSLYSKHVQFTLIEHLYLKLLKLSLSNLNRKGMFTIKTYISNYFKSKTIQE